MKVIIKDIENIYGQIDKCHIVEWAELNLKGGKSKTRIYSYASVAAYEAGKPPTMCRDIMVNVDGFSDPHPHGKFGI